MTFMTCGIHSFYIFRASWYVGRRWVGVHGTCGTFAVAVVVPTTFIVVFTGKW